MNSDYVSICHIRFLLLFAFLHIAIVSYCQYNLSITGPEKTDYCKPIVYEYKIENFAVAPAEGLRLQLEFSEDVLLDPQGATIQTDETNPRIFYLDLSESLECDFLSGTINVIPFCPSGLFFLQTKASLLSGDILLAESETQSLLGSPALSLNLGNYNLDTRNNLLSKTIRLRNVSSASIDQFDIRLIYSEGFASLNSASLGAITDTDMLSIIASDLPNGSLDPGKDIEIEVVHEILGCNINSLRYNLIFPCEISDCEIVVPFVDDNEVDRFLLEVQGANFLNYGICEHTFNSFVIKHKDLEVYGTINTAFDLSWRIGLSDRTKSYLPCIDPFITINGRDVPLTPLEDFVFEVDFVDLFTEDIDGAGGIQDLDGDGFFDDLARGDSLSFELGFYSEEDCNVQIRPTGVGIYASSSAFCGLEKDANSYSGTLKGINGISAKPWTMLPKDADGDRYYKIGDTILWELNYQYGTNQDPLCDEEDMVLTILIPPNLRWLEEYMAFWTLTDSLQLPVLRQDSFLITNFDGRQTGLFRMSFIALCPENPLKNYNPNLPIEEQCLEWKTYNLKASISNQCKGECLRTIDITPTFGTTFRTLCEEEEIYKNVTSLDSFTIHRINGGWMDSAQTMRWDPDIYSDSPNNHYFYDHDTMRIRVPISFNRPDVLDELKITIGNRLNRQEVDLVLESSQILVFQNGSANPSDQCDVGYRTTDGTRDITLSLRRTDIENLCFNELDSLVWELYIVINMERSENLQTNTFQPEDIRLFAEERVGTCFETFYYQEDSYWVSEVFNPNLFQISNSFGFQGGAYSIEDVMDWGITIIPILLNDSVDLDYESRFPIKLATFNVEIPNGYILDDDVFLLNTFSTRNSLFFGIVQSDTLDTLFWTEKVNTDSSQIYSFQMDLESFSKYAFNQNIYLNGSIRLSCPPSKPITQFAISGTIQYDDYYEGSLEAIDLPFNLKNNLEYNPFTFSFFDGFQITGRSELMDWVIIDEERRSFLDLFDNNRTVFQFEYFSNNISIDTFFYADYFDEEIKKDFVFPIYQEKVGEKVFLLQDTSGSSSLAFMGKQVLQFQTSGQVCGYDTLVIQYGPQATWDNGVCPEVLYRDTLIIYTPVGVPQLSWRRNPETLSFCEENWFRWQLSNIGEGPLSNIEIQINAEDLGSPQLALEQGGQTIDISSSLVYEADIYKLNLEELGLDTLVGLIDTSYQDVFFDLRWTADCESNTLFNIDITTQGLTACGSSVSSRPIRLDDIPLEVNQDSAYHIELEAISGPVCGDTIMIRATITTDDPSLLINDSLLIYLPKEILVFPGSASVGRLPIADPNIKYSGDNQILSWSNIVRPNADGLFVIEVLLSSECTDICGRGEGRAILMSQLAASCGTETCDRYITRAASGPELLFWRPKMELLIEDFEILQIQDGMMQAAITWNLNQLRNHLYEGSITAKYYGDNNGNQLIGSDEIVFDESIFFLNADQQLRAIDTISIIVSDACDLGLFIALERDCNCFSDAESIGLMDQLATRQDVLLCVSNEYQLEKTEFENCNRIWENNPRLEIGAQNQAVYIPSLTPGFVGLDTIVGIFDCDDCDFVDSIFITVYELSSEIIVTVPACSDRGAALSAVVNHPSPDSLRFNWSFDPNTNSPNISNIPVGPISVEVTDKDGCTSSASYIVAPYQFIYEISLTGDPCDTEFGQSVSFLSGSDSDSLSVTWQDGTTGSVRNNLFSGTYYYEISSNNGCSLFDSLIISSSQLDAISYLDTYVVSLADSIQITPQGLNVLDGYTITWSSTEVLSCTDCFTPLIKPTGVVSIVAVIADPIGCVKSDTITIQVENDINIYIPNALLLSGSPLNSILFPSPHPSVELIEHIRVFDRWGNSLMNKENVDPRDQSQGWRGDYNGSNVTPGVYVYDIKVRLVDASTIRFTSTITVLN